MRAPSLLAGIFVGGRASRMHGVAKGLLALPDGESIVGRTRRLLEAAGASCVLVGAGPAYAEIGLPQLADEPGIVGPLAGLVALLGATGGRALAVACDMPFWRAEILQRLIDAPPAPIVAPRHRVAGRLVWEPLFARYDARVVLPIARAFASEGQEKLQLLLDRAGAAALPLDPEETRSLVDWDAPEDLPGGRLP